VENTVEIPGYPGYRASRDGHVWSTYSNKWLCEMLHRRGYPQVLLKIDKSTYRLRYVHRLVALAFIPNPKLMTQVNHIDGNKQNNCVDNLEWVDNLENARHAMAHGLMPHAKIDEPTAHVICQRLENGEKVVDIARDLNVPYYTVHAIRLGRNWKEVSTQYTIPGKRKRRVVFTPEEVRHIYYNAVVKGYPIGTLAEQYQVDPELIRRIASGKNYRKITREMCDAFE